MSPEQTRLPHGNYYSSSYSPSSSAQPAARQTIKFLTAATIGISLMLLSALTLTATVIGLILATPVLVLFSPILVPAGIALVLAASGFVFSGSCGVAAIAALSWIYNYVAGNHPAGSDRLDYAGSAIADKARDVKEKAKDYANFGQGGRTQYETTTQAY